ncbi:MAG: helix-turn-helix domain-containing protein [Lachnospiraceae bacterium]|nr:helix-turn-helix domain-containing protein [Lachnospiraceae bacterium]
MEKYYTVEQVAKLLSMHPKTIQRYIREGKLRANKIGKSWCVAGHDLSVFAEKTDNSNHEDVVYFKDKTIVSSVVDIGVDDSEESDHIVTMLTAALNSKPKEYGMSSMHTQYLGYENKLRVTLWGNLEFMKAVFEILSCVTQKKESL